MYHMAQSSMDPAVSGSVDKKLNLTVAPACGSTKYIITIINTIIILTCTYLMLSLFLYDVARGNIQ